MEKKPAKTLPVLIVGFQKRKALAIASCINNHSVEIVGGFHDTLKVLSGNESEYRLIVFNADNFSDQHIRNMHERHESKNGAKERSVAVCSDNSKRVPKKVKKLGLPLVRRADLSTFLTNILSQG